MTSAGGPPPGASNYSGPGGQSGPPAHEPPLGGNGLAAEVHTLERAIFEVKRIIVGQDQLVERMLVGLLSKGHVLLEGVPGVAKTLAVETFARVVGGTFARIQFTPDLVPTDIIGTRIYRQGREEFDTELGPVVVNFLLADEINRAPAKVQSALLEVMQERQVTIGHDTHSVPEIILGWIITWAAVELNMLQRLLDTTSLSGREWIVVLALSLLAPAVVAVDKAIQLSRQGKASSTTAAEPQAQPALQATT